MTLPLLKVGPPLAARKESVELKELGGSVVVRGLLASEVFAVVGIRTQALRRLRAEQRQHAEADEEGGAMQAPPSTGLEFAEMVQYGTHVSHLLALAVQGEGGLALYTVDEWEIFAQHHPAAYRRLQVVAERLSGLDEKAVEKNSPQSQS